MSQTRSQPDRQAIAEHLTALHHCAEGLNGLLVLAGFGEEPTTGLTLQPMVEHFAIGDTGKMTDRAMEWTVQQHRNVYTPLAVMRVDLPPGKKGDEKDIVAVLGLVADLDDADATQWAARTPILPSGILETSPQRFQLFYLFDRSLDVEPAKDLARRLQAHTRCDFGTKDLSHVWRIAGTLNHPNKKKLDAGRSAGPCVVIEVPGGTDAVINSAVLDAALPVLLPPVIRAKPRRARPIEADDQTLIDMMLQASNGSKVRALWDGDWGGYESQSQGDLAFANHLAFWCGRDEARMDRLFRQSGLMRDKWDERHGERTYGEMTLAHACESCRETYSPSRTTSAGVSSEMSCPPTETTRSDNEPGLTKLLADEILRTEHFAQDVGGALYTFVGGNYRPTGEERIAQCVKAILIDNGDSKRWSSHRAREVQEFIRVDAPRLWERPPVDALNLLNGILDVPSRALRSHDPAFLSPVQLPVTYDSTATCPSWETFVARVLPEDCQILPYELVAASMRGEIADQKAVLLVGAGHNGKSTLLGGIVAFLGRENVASLALHRLELDKFSVVRLLGKLANICADLPSDHLASTSTFKALTGGDRLTAERKFQGSFEFTPFARLLFSSNHYPQSKDNSEAFFRRWLAIPFDAVIEPQERILDLSARLADPRELSGVLNRALAVLATMRSRGGFSQSETTRAAAMEFREMTDPIAAWLDRHTLLFPDNMVTKKDLLIAFNGMAEAGGRPPMSPKAFYAGVKRIRPTIKEAQRTVRNGVKDVFLGIGLQALSPSQPAPSEGLFHEEVVNDDH